MQDVGKLLLDRKSTRLNSSHTVIYTLSLHDALPICSLLLQRSPEVSYPPKIEALSGAVKLNHAGRWKTSFRSEEHTSELQSHRDLHSFPTRRSSDLFFTFAEVARSLLPTKD